MDWSTGRMGFLKFISRSLGCFHFGFRPLESKKISINEHS